MVKNVAIVSLSSGIIGERSVEHELDIGLKRLENYGLNVCFAPHALSGLEYLNDHPEARADDLLWAMREPDIDMVLCAIGGDDTYRLLPYLFDNSELRDAACDRIFLGFSDTTDNHFMLHKIGMRTFYGQAFLSDVCELDSDMLPYTKKYFEELIRTGGIGAITPSDVWYEQRVSFGEDQIGVPPVSHPDRGFELLQGSPVFSGKILGGCIDSMFDFLDGGRYADIPEMCKKYGLFPELDDWRGRILLLESSEEKMSPEKYRKALGFFKDYGLFDVISGVLVGKPMDEAYESEYKEALVDVIGDPGLPVVCNINVGHASPRCIIPFGVTAEVNAAEQIIKFL